MNYNGKNQRLGLTIMREEVDTGDAIRLGVKEGIADTAKWATLGLLAIGIYLVMPNKWVRKLRREVRKLK